MAITFEHHEVDPTTKRRVIGEEKNTYRVAIVLQKETIEERWLIKTLKSLTKKLKANKEEIYLEYVLGYRKDLDKAIEKYCYDEDIPFVYIRPDWVKHGTRASFYRDKELIDYITQCLAIWDGKAPELKHLIETCREYRIPTVIIKPGMDHE